MDLFIEYSTGSYSFDVRSLPSSRCGFVDERNIKKYFGPFAGRAFWGVSGQLVNANTAKRSHLESVVGVGKATADLILRKRQEKHFEDSNDLVKRIPSLRNKTSCFVFEY